MFGVLNFFSESHVICAFCGLCSCWGAWWVAQRHVAACADMPSSSIADEPRAVHIDIPVTTRERHWGRLTTWLPAAVVFVVCLVVAMHVVVSARSRAREDVLDDLIHLAGDKMASHVAMTNERMNMIPSLAHVFMDRVNRTHTPLPQKGVDTAVEHFMGEKSDVTIECLCFSVSMRVTDAERADFETHSWRPISQPLPQDPNVAPNASNVVGDPYPEHALPVYYPIVTTYPASYSWAKFVDDRNRSAVRAAAVNKTLHTLDTAVGTLGQTPRGLAYSFVQAIPTSAADRTHDGYISFKITVDSLWQKFSVDGWVMTETLVDQTIGAVLMDHLPQDYGDTHVQVALWHIQLLSHDWVYTIYVAEELLQQKADEASNFVPQLIMGIGCSMLAGFVVAFATVEFRRWQTMNADSIRHTASTAAHEEMLRLMNHGTPSSRRRRRVLLVVSVCLCGWIGILPHVIDFSPVLVSPLFNHFVILSLRACVPSLQSSATP